MKKTMLVCSLLLSLSAVAQKAKPVVSDTAKHDFELVDDGAVLAYVAKGSDSLILVHPDRAARKLFAEYRQSAEQLSRAYYENQLLSSIVSSISLMGTLTNAKQFAEAVKKWSEYQSLISK